MRERKMGGKPVLRVWVQDSDDLTRSLLPSRSGDQVASPGLRGLMVDTYQGAFDLGLIQGSNGRADVLVQDIQEEARPHVVRCGMREHGLDVPLSPAQASLFGDEIDVVLLSAKPDVVQAPWRHRESGYLVNPPPGWEEAWTPSGQAWLREQFEPTEPSRVERSKDAMLSLIRAVKQRSGAHVIVYNCSPIDPTDRVHNYHGLDDTLSVRVHRFNLALMQLSVLEGISIIDVERVVAEIGQAHVPSALRYSADAYQAICREVLRVLQDIGFFEARPLVMQVGRRPS